MYYHNNTWRSRSAKIMVIVALVCGVTIFVQSMNRWYELGRDIESVAHRAQVAADADDMLVYMMDLKSNMEMHGITEGYSVPIYQTPANDLSLLYESVNRIIERLDQIKDLPKSETAYQVGLDDLRGTIRELESPSFGLVITQFWLLWLIGIALWAWPVNYLLKYS